MAKLNYNLDDIKTFTVEPGKYRARLTKVEQTLSSKKKPMLVWYFKIVAGSEKGKELKFWASLEPTALQNMKMVLEAFGLRGKIKKDSSDLVGKHVIIVVALRPGVDRAGNEAEFANIIAFRKDKSAAEVDDDDDDDDEYEEEDDEVDDEDVDDEEEVDEDDEDEDEDEDDEDEEEVVVRKKKKLAPAVPAKKLKKKGKIPF